MKGFDVRRFAASVVAASMRLLERIEALPRSVLMARLSNKRNVPYENISLDITIDIRDAAGRTAVLSRRHVLRMLREEPVAIRDIVWGEGKPLAGYRVEGARRIDLKSEGSRRAVLLSLDRPGAMGERVVVRTRRFLESAFLDELEYFETSLERPTGRVSMKVLFPKTRPPREAHLVTAIPDRELRRIRTRYGHDRRPYLVWHERRPEQFRTYSLRWRW